MRNSDYKINIKNERAIINILGEISWGLKVTDFEKKIGVKPEVVHCLLEKLIKHEKAGDTEVFLNTEDIEVIRKAFKEVENQIEEWEFETRLGVSLDEVKKISILA